MHTPRLQELDAWAREHAALAHTVCLAMAFAQCKREQVDAYVLPIFKTYTFRVTPEWADVDGATVTTPKDLYLTDEEEKCTAYYAECEQAHRAHGFDGPAGQCPALVAEHLLTQVENLFLDAGCALLGIEREGLVGDLRQRFLNLLLGACLKTAPTQEG
jgi:hypothetical protein